MGDEIRLTVKPDGAVEYAAYCLRTDSWHDYLAFTADAARASAAGDTRATNRFLRAALTCFFSHVEGVVKHIEDQRGITVRRDQGLCNRMQAITRLGRRHAYIPAVELRLEKSLRDLIAHPGIVKDFRTGTDGEVALDQADVFERLDAETLARLEAKVIPWVVAVCEALRVYRFTDTAERCRLLAERLGGLGRASTTEV